MLYMSRHKPLSGKLKYSTLQDYTKRQREGEKRPREGSEKGTSERERKKKSVASFNELNYKTTSKFSNKRIN